MPTVTLTLPDTLDTFVASQIKEGGFADATEYFTSLIVLEHERRSRDRLKELLLEGVRSEARSLTDEEWRAIDCEVEELTDKDKRP